jgi:hypothetical protein
MATKLNALKRVGNFCGDTDVERWLDKMEVALRIDRIETEQHADVLVLHLEGAAYDAWKGLFSADQADAAKIKATHDTCSWRTYGCHIRGDKKIRKYCGSWYESIRSCGSMYIYDTVTPTCA